MALVAATLAAGLVNMTPTNSEASAISAFADAWGTYFATAMAGPVPYSGDPTSTAKNALKAAMVGCSAFDQGAAKIQAGIVAYWGAIVAAPPSFFAAAVAVVPPAGLVSIAATLLPIFASNTAGNLPLATAALNVANALHASNQGGTATIPPPPGNTYTIA